MEIHYKPGFINAKQGCMSVFSITLEQKVRQCAVAQHTNDRPISMRELKHRAVTTIAQNIVDELHYEQVPSYGPFEPIQHIFSVKDYTIAESAVKKQMIVGLQADLDYLNRLYEDLTNSYQQAKHSYRYNNRSILIKCRDWLLYDKPFTKEILWK